MENGADVRHKAEHDGGARACHEPKASRRNSRARQRQMLRSFPLTFQ
jgi:hypothetical protein